MRRLATKKVGIRPIFVFQKCQIPVGSIPCALCMMGKTDDALGTVQDALYVAKDFLVHAEYKQFEKEMMVLANQAGNPPPLKSM